MSDAPDETAHAGGLFATVVAAWLQRPDDALVHAEWRGACGGLIIVKPTLERAARAFAAEAGFPVAVEVDTAGRLGADARERATRDIARELTARHVDEYALGIDPVTNQLTLSVPASLGIPIATLRSIARGAAVAATGRPLAVVIEITSTGPQPAVGGEHDLNA